MSKKSNLEDLAGVGAFVDTSGSKKYNQPESAGDHEEELRDEVEERLETLVFGKQPFQPVVGTSASGDLFESSDSDEVNTQY